MPADRSPQTSGEENTIRNIVTGLHKPSLLKSMCFNLELVRKNGKFVRAGAKPSLKDYNVFGFKLFRERFLIMIRTRGVKQHNSFIRLTILYIPNNDPNTWG